MIMSFQEEKYEYSGFPQNSKTIQDPLKKIKVLTLCLMFNSLQYEWKFLAGNLLTI